jgi:hypothetical protein
MTFESEVCVAVTVDVLDVTRARPGRYGDAPERSYPAEGDSLELSVKLGGLDITAALPAPVLEALAAEALEQLEEP